MDTQRIGYSLSVLVLALSMGACFHSPNNPDSDPPEWTDSYFPLADGLTWTYMTEDGEELVTSVQGSTSVSGYTYVRVVTSSNPPREELYRQDSLGVMLYADSPAFMAERFIAAPTDSDLDESVLSIQAGDLDYLRYPLLNGSSWNAGMVAGTLFGVFKDEGNESFPFEVSMNMVVLGEVVATDSITTPAGTFGAQRVKWEIVTQDVAVVSGLEGLTFYIDAGDPAFAWFAKGVGLVKYSDRDGVVHLVSFTENGVPVR
jgi:hypothetical protein